MRFSVYVHADADGTPLYVGKTGRGRKRDEEHGGEKVWWPRVAVTYRIHLPSERLMCGAEGFLIDAYRALSTFNQRRGDRGWVNQTKAAYWMMTNPGVAPKYVHTPFEEPVWGRLPHRDVLDARWKYLRGVRDEDYRTQSWFADLESWREWRSTLDTDWTTLESKRTVESLSELAQWLKEVSFEEPSAPTD